MLPKYYKFKIVNDCGQSISSTTLTWTPYKWLSGGPSYATNATPVSAQTIASAATYTSAAIDNTSALNAGGVFVFQATLAGAPSGNQALRVYLVPSADNSVFEDQSSVLVAALLCAATGAATWGGEVLP